MEKEVNLVSPSAQMTEKKVFNYCSDELVLDYSVMNFPDEDLGAPKLQPILNYFW